MTKFRHIPVAGRTIIVTVAAGVFAIALVACATSYNAIYRLVGMLDLYGYRTNQGFPLLLDAAFLVAELAAILGGIMRAVTHSDEVTRGWPFVTVVLCALGTIAFNVGHAYLIGGRHDPLSVWRCVVASLPPVLMILSFQVLIAIVKWTMLHLGRPLNSAAVLSPTPASGYGTVTVRPAVPGAWWPQAPSGQVPSSAGSENPQNGQAEVTKRQQVEAYLARLGPDQLGQLTAREVAAGLTDAGMDVSERYVAQILDQWTAARRGSSPRTPRR